MLDELKALTAFSRVVEAGSFSRAAAQLGLTKSAVSKHVANLEGELGARLLVRTTRKLSLTDAGERVYQSAQRIIGEAAALRECARSESSELRGHLRVTAPAVLGHRYLTPLISEFLASHPGISLELLLSDTVIDLVSERIDLALRIGRPGRSTLVAKKLATIPLRLCAAPSYLARHGTPKTPGDLSGHELIQHGRNEPIKLSLTRKGRTSTVSLHGRLTMSDGQGSVRAACTGYGLVIAPEIEVADEIENGALVPLLLDYQLDTMALSAVYPMGSPVPSRVRALLGFIEARFRKPPWRR